VSKTQTKLSLSKTQWTEKMRKKIARRPARKLESLRLKSSTRPKKERLSSKSKKKKSLRHNQSKSSRGQRSKDPEVRGMQVPTTGSKSPLTNGAKRH